MRILTKSVGVLAAVLVLVSVIVPGIMNNAHATIPLMASQHADDAGVSSDGHGSVPADTCVGPECSVHDVMAYCVGVTVHCAPVVVSGAAGIGASAPASSVVQQLFDLYPLTDNTENPEPPPPRV